MTLKKKLIEVALPLPEINDASAYDKMPGIGPHPKGIHQWWARLPLPTARAVLFASVVDDPEAHPEIWPTEEAQNAERERLFDILRRMMGKKLHEAQEVYAEAQEEMLRHCDGRLPIVFDPFAGGGSIPLEANRLGLEAHAGDLNPIAVLLNKCNLELAPRWAGHAPVNPEDRGQIGGSANWRGTRGLAADMRYYGRIIRERAQGKIGHLYPMVRLPKDHGNREVAAIAWLWTRTIQCSNPACGARAPLIRSFWLVRKKPRFVIAKPKFGFFAQRREKVQSRLCGHCNDIMCGEALKENYRQLFYPFDSFTRGSGVIAEDVINPTLRTFPLPCFITVDNTVGLT